MNLFILSLLFPLLVATTVYASGTADEKRIGEAEERGTHVMPFDVEKTSHVFSKTPDGGIQQVFAKDKSNATQIQLIRDHLSDISKEFEQGNFSNPAHIHQEDIPGLAELKTADPDQIKVEYRWLPDGAQLNYTTKLPKFIKAIHQWFDAQLSD